MKPDIFTPDVVTLRSWLERPSTTNLTPGKFAVGIDVGATAAAIIAIDHNGVPVKRLGTAADDDHQLEAELPIDKGPLACLQVIHQLFAELLDATGLRKNQIVIVGLDSPGPSTKDGVLFKSPNLNHPDWSNFPLRAMIERFLGITTFYANDGDIAAWLDDLELTRPDQLISGAQRSTVGCYIGTGFGGGTVLDGELWQGKSGAAAELGHMDVVIKPDFIDPGVPICGCGSAGCVEAYVSLTALKRQLDSLLPRCHSGALMDLHPLWLDAVSTEAHKAFEAFADEGTTRAKQILRLAAEDNALARLLLHKQAIVLGTFLAGLVCHNEPDYVVIGGGILTATLKVRKRYMSDMRAAFEANAFPIHIQSCKLVFSNFEDAATYASALRAATLY